MTTDWHKEFRTQLGAESILLDDWGRRRDWLIAHGHTSEANEVERCMRMLRRVNAGEIPYSGDDMQSDLHTTLRLIRKTETQQS